MEQPAARLSAVPALGGNFAGPKGCRTGWREAAAAGRAAAGSPRVTADDTQGPSHRAAANVGDSLLQTQRNGCFSTEVPVASFNLTSFRYGGWLYANASLLEEGTGMWRTVTKSRMIVRERVTITFENTDKFYKPGIPYTGTMLLKGTNSSALKEKELLLVVNTRGGTQRKTLLVDGSGRASFELDTSGWNYEVSLRGELKDNPPALEHEGKEYLNYQSVARYLYPFSSDSKSFLRIHRVEKKLPCSQPHQLRVDYLIDEKATGIELQSLDVVFLVSLHLGREGRLHEGQSSGEENEAVRGRGSNSLSMRVLHSLPSSACAGSPLSIGFIVPISSSVLAKGTIVTVLRKELPAAAGLRGSFSLELPIGPELAPMAKVLGYAVLPDGEMVADSTKLKVAKCFPNKVSGGCQSRGSCCWARCGDVGTEACSSAEPFLIACNRLVPDSPLREGFPSSPVPVAAANHLLALISLHSPSSAGVNLSFSEQRAVVGSQLRLKVRAAPGSLCALYAVDQRTQSSGPKDKLNPSTVSLEKPQC
ncbi:LOW QUALITY PROTEIN: hypothetical protein QYF61_002609 [Mycteria americana]|uniref:Alpha-2-macroglobulin bait region domain-containing protein n=1 Tax=Mycteria americana TaxID=33587 RepID=A0AAN7N455_MYCAM|nr:LOW QUALITY PROTEIN: hypothetical protein QYF61_002609 [Mycteria americana]